MHFKEKEKQKIPQALANLAQAAGLNLQILHNARRAGDDGQIETLIAQANDRLAHEMKNNWSQSRIVIRLRCDGWRLIVLVSGDGGPYLALAERSDGLRQFVALMAFLAREPNLTIPPVLLIDEVEQRLHYDAQADLVQMLARQDASPTVIYSTHSLGCLPEDLGSGVKMVTPIGHFSSIDNAFWASNTPGFSPLLFGMGALTLAFIPIRYALVVEGPSDMLLLPALVREVTQRESTGYQVVPGLSIAGPDQVSLLEHQAPRVLFLVDNDEGGARIRKKLVNSGVEDKRIHSLTETEELSVIEDLVDPELYRRAVYNLLQRHNAQCPTIPDQVLRPPNVPAQLEQWCKEAHLQAPSKVAVAYQLLEYKAENASLLHATYARRAIEDIDTRISDMFKVAGRQAV